MLWKVLTLLGLLGIQAVFLPFTYDASPARGALDRDVWRIAAPFFLSLLISSASLRWVLAGRLSPPERLIAYLLSGATALVTLSVVITVMQDWSRAEEFGSCVIVVLTLVVGGYLVIRNWRMGVLRELSAVMAMQIACLILLFLPRKGPRLSY